MGKINKRIVAFIFAICMMVPFTSNVYAAVVSVNAVDNGNGTYTVSIGTSLTGAVTVNTTNGSVLYWCEGGSCSVQQGNSTFSGVGTVSVVAIPSNPMDDGNGGKVSDVSGGSMSLTLKSQSNTSGGGNTNENLGGGTTQTTPTETEKENKNDEKKDTDSSLKSLEINTGELSPKFSSATTSYEVNLPASTTGLKVAATANSSKASVSGTGLVELKTGVNTIEIVCSAEDGSTTVYKIKATVSDKPVAYVKFGKVRLGVLNEVASVSKLFTQTKIKIDGKEVTAYKNEALKLTLVYMQNEKTGIKDFYMYDEDKGIVTSIYKPFAYDGKNLAIINVPKNLQTQSKMKYTTIKLGEFEVYGWTYKDKKFSNYAIIYVMDEAGNKVYYQYEKKENSLQLFSNAAAISQEDYETYVEQMEGQNQLYMILVIALSIVSVSLLIAFIVSIRKRRHNIKFKKIKIEQPLMDAEAKALLEKEE